MADMTYTAQRVPYVRPDHGLYTAAQVVTHTNDEWALGDVQWVDWCDRARVWDLPCHSPGDSPGESPGDGTKVPSEPTIATAGPFTVYFYPQCRTGPSAPSETEGAATEVLDATEQTAVEREFWTTVLNDCTALPATDDVRCALGQVEQQLRWLYPGLGVVHVPLWALPYLTDVNAVVSDGAFLRTVAGTPVVAGGGYFGVPGSGAAFDGFHVVGTGAVRVDRGPVFDVSSVDYARNVQGHLAERNVAVGFGCVCVTAAVTTCTPAPLPGY